MRSEAEEEVDVQLRRISSPLVEELGLYLQRSETPLKEVMQDKIQLNLHL